MTTGLNIVLLAPHCDGSDVGEAFWAHEWTRHLAQQARVTLLTQTRAGRTPASRQLPGVDVVEWPEFALPGRFERVSAMLKPGYFRFGAKARNWLRSEIRSGRKIDLVHQLTPVALRYPSPARGLGIPYVLGPHAGSLPTPSGFRVECRSAPLFTRLRSIDQYRLMADPWLRRSFADAACVIGVAPYVRDMLRAIALRRFEVMSELGVEEMEYHDERTRKPGELRLLHVGRAVRTKGLRDSIRALALLREHPGITLTQAGHGEELAICRQEAIRLGVERRVRFLGQIPRHEVEKLYAEADVFLFPSFREPSGSVVFEAMRHGLPVIAADCGGPGYVVDDSCGITVPARYPGEFASLLAGAIAKIANDSRAIQRLSSGARLRVASLGYWPNKIARMTDLYRSILGERSQARKGA
jgi:glycosyltransferase involved in cell wall biosynthesis